MGRRYNRDADGKFAPTGTSKGAAPIAAAKAPPKRSTAKKVAIGVGAGVALGASAGVLKVRHDALARFAARQAAAALRASDVTSSW